MAFGSNVTCRRPYPFTRTLIEEGASPCYSRARSALIVASIRVAGYDREQAAPHLRHYYLNTMA